MIRACGQGVKIQGWNVVLAHRVRCQQQYEIGQNCFHCFSLSSLKPCAARMRSTRSNRSIRSFSFSSVASLVLCVSVVFSMKILSLSRSAATLLAKRSPLCGGRGSFSMSTQLQVGAVECY